MRQLCVSLLAFALGAGLAHGETREAVDMSAQAAFVAGEYAEAVRLARAQGEADSYALAARAVLAEAMCARDLPSTALLSEAESLARLALAHDPRHVEGRLQLAIALSLRTRAMSRMEAWRSGLGSEAQGLVESVLADDPGNAYAHGFLAVWHLEVVRRGGRMGASMMGASTDRAFEHYEIAAWLSPDDAALHWQMARALAADDPQQFESKINLALDRALAAHRDTALEDVMARRAERLRAVMQAGDPDAARALAQSLL